MLACFVALAMVIGSVAAAGCTRAESNGAEDGAGSSRSRSDTEGSNLEVPSFPVDDIIAADPLDLIFDLGAPMGSTHNGTPGVNPVLGDGSGVAVTQSNWEHVFGSAECRAVGDEESAWRNGMIAAASERWAVGRTRSTTGMTVQLTIRKYESLAAVEDRPWAVGEVVEQEPRSPEIGMVVEAPEATVYFSGRRIDPSHENWYTSEYDLTIGDAVWVQIVVSAVPDLDQIEGFTRLMLGHWISRVRDAFMD